MYRPQRRPVHTFYYFGDLKTLMESIKQRVREYWSQRAEGFEQQRLREYDSEKKVLWITEFQRYLPQKKPLRILDIGTGTGFFACMLAAEGHETIGIDLSEEMLAHGQHMASVLGLNVQFMLMDAEEPAFEAECFDALVTRNLTWTLPHLSLAYREWYRILKPDGVLINFDADYNAALRNAKGVELPENHAHKLVPERMIAENDAITRTIGALHQPRPEWDVKLLKEAGFKKIITDPDVYKRIYAEIDEFYNPAPVFAVAAYK